MALKDILSTIEKQAKAEIKTIQEKAKKEAEQILSAAKQEAKKSKIRTLKEFKLKKMKEAQNTILKKKRANYKVVLEKKREIMDGIFKQALKQLKELNSLQKEKLLLKLKRDLPQGGKIIKSKEGGFKFISEDLEIDNTFPTLINEVRDKIEAEVVRILFQ